MLAAGSSENTEPLLQPTLLLGWCPRPHANWAAALPLSLVLALKCYSVFVYLSEGVCVYLLMYLYVCAHTHLCAQGGGELALSTM